MSGGADSLALAFLAEGWARARGGRATALIVDHGLRPEAADEARRTFERLSAGKIAARVLTLKNLARGPRMAERARAARYDVLEAACAEAGIVHLLLGHHAADQAETVVIRARSKSGPAGLAAMAAVVETARVRLLRPLLPVPPVRLRQYLRALGADWEEDPSNADPASLRALVRLERGDPDGTGAETRALLADAWARGCARASTERAVADQLARRVCFDPAGFAIVFASEISPAALGAVIATIAGTRRPPRARGVAALAARLAPATLGGARILRGGRLAPGGWIVAREAAAMAPAVPACPGAVWDGRFRMAGARPGLMLGPLGADATRLRDTSRLPFAVLCTLPALRQNTFVVEVPHLARKDGGVEHDVIWSPSRPVACASFAPTPAECYGRGCGERIGTLCSSSPDGARVARAGRR